MSQLQNATGLFEDMAEAISAKYLAQVKAITARLGTRPTFDELMIELKHLEKELTKQGIKYIEDYNANNANPPDITMQLKEVIKTTIERFVRQL